ncbi:MAG TPA: class I adenylate-forming enzyme family protein [Mycobacteriales bacterium]|nr:class I adenylate-forming enzyme family protein [Mycobacteriales bacterium]
MLLRDLAGEAARRHGDRIAYTAGDHHLTFAELDRISDEVAAGLAERGVQRGDVVVLVLPTALAYPLAYLGAAKVGAITLGINTRLARPEQQHLLDLVTPAVIITAYDGTPGDVCVRVDGLGVLDELRIAGGRPPAAEPLAPDDPIAFVATSGTTGKPKAAIFAGRQLDAIRHIDVGDTWSGGGATLSGTSLAHLGFMTKLPGHLQRGSTAHLLRRWTARDALAMTAEHRLTTLSGVPTQLSLMLADPTLPETDLSSVRLVMIGGGPATPALVRAARESFGAPVCSRYSCTEAGIGLGTHPDDPPEDAETTVGRPQPGVELAVRDADGHDVPDGETGEVLLRSAAVTSGYWRNPEATAALFSADGFVRTGDHGWRDGQGRLHLVGRGVERYVRGGYNVFPVAVESVLASAPGVRAIAVVPRADDVWGEVGVAFVVAADAGRPPTLDAICAHGAASLARHELPAELVLVGELPLTAGDKLDRRSLRARLP